MAIDQGDENHMPHTPTPKSLSQKRIEKNLTQLRSRTTIQLGKVQPSAPTPKTSDEPVPEPLFPSSGPENKPDPSTHETVEAPQIPVSRLNTVRRLNKAFWKSATMTESLLDLCPSLKEQSQQECSEVIYQDTM